MGVCCSKEPHFGGIIYDKTEKIEYEEEEKEEQEQEDGDIRNGDYGSRVRLHGYSRYISMYTQQGRKGVNQDAMTVWEDFAGEKGVFFCGVFDGHGPLGHKVSCSVRDILPSKLSSAIKLSRVDQTKYSDINGGDTEDDKHAMSNFRWESDFIKSFEKMDEELNLDTSIDSYCSGSTSVVVVRKGDMLIIANLGDSRAVLCTRNEENRLVPVQLTVDLKPNIQSESERIKKCRGRVFALDREPDVFRIWMPDEDYPGLAMSRCFGDFCLKDHGLSSVPKVICRKLTNDDEFVVLATDGVWDVLTNKQVINIVASAKRRSMAAKLLVSEAVRIWRIKYPGFRSDDCTAICLFFSNRRLPTKSLTEIAQSNVSQSELGDVAYTELAVCRRSPSCSNDRDSEAVNEKITLPEDVNVIDSITKLPRYGGFLSRRKSSKVPADLS